MKKTYCDLCGEQCQAEDPDFDVRRDLAVIGKVGGGVVVAGGDNLAIYCAPKIRCLYDLREPKTPLGFRVDVIAPSNPNLDICVKCIFDLVSSADKRPRNA